MARCVARRSGWRAAWIALAALLLAGALALCAFARAEGEGAQLRIEVDVRPEGMVEPGGATLSFTIENTSGREASNVYLASADGLVFEQLGRIAPGETRSFSREHEVSEAELEAGEILYTVTQDDPDDPNVKVNYAVRAAIQRSEARPEVEFTRQFSSRSAASGGAITIAYRLRNTGSVPLRELMVQDSLGSYTGRVDALEVGESRTLLNRAAAVEDAVSDARLSYRAEGGEELLSEELEPVPIGIARGGLQSSFSADYSAFSRTSANVVLTLYNEGNVDYRDLCVIDELYGGVIADELSLSAGGAPLEVSRAYSLRGDQRFQWRVLGRSAAGEEIDLLTEAVALPEREAGSPEMLSLSVRALTPRIRRAGNVTFRVNIENPGGVELRDLTLSEANLGALHSFAVLPADGAIERDFVLPVSEDASYSFTLRASTTAGEAAQASAGPVEVAIASDGVLPEGAQERFLDFSGGSIKIGGSSTFAVLLLAGCAVLLALIVALIIATRRARLERQIRAAEERKRRREEMGRTNRFTPVRAPKPQKPPKKSKGKGRRG